MTSPFLIPPTRLWLVGEVALSSTTPPLKYFRSSSVLRRQEENWTSTLSPFTLFVRSKIPTISLVVCCYLYLTDIIHCHHLISVWLIKISDLNDATMQLHVPWLSMPSVTPFPTYCIIQAYTYSFKYLTSYGWRYQLVYITLLCLRSQSKPLGALWVPHLCLLHDTDKHQSVFSRPNVFIFVFHPSR